LLQKILKISQKTSETSQNFMMQTKIKGAQYFCVANIFLKKNLTFFDFSVILG
jgi:hypothetical protein